VQNPHGSSADPGTSRRDPVKELQARIEAAIDDVRPKIRRALEELDARVDEAMADIKPRARSAMDEVRPRVDQFVADVQPRLDSLLQRLQRKIEELRRDLDERAARSKASDRQAPVGQLPPAASPAAVPDEGGGESASGT
jgi:ElaB/YqjD/DUF883 family membrane-anchored ribosome-binding protein